MADLFSLSADDQKFFETGELTPAMLAEQEAAAKVIADAEAAQLAEKAASDKAAADALVAAEAAKTTQTQQVDQTEFLRQQLLSAQRAQVEAETRLRLAEEARNKPAEVVAPNPDTDPLGAMMHQLNTVNKTVIEMQQKLMEQQSAQQQQQQLIQFQASMRSLRDDFAKTTPDFDKAYQHLRSARTEDMKMLGGTETQIQQVLLQEEFALAQNAVNQGKNPAQVMYEMAKRHGYNPGTQTTTTNQASTAAAQKLAQIAAGQAASKNVPSSPAHNSTEVTLEGLKEASDSDLNKLVMDDDAWSKMTGRGGKDIFS